METISRGTGGPYGKTKGRSAGCQYWPTNASCCPLAVEQCRCRQETRLDDQLFRNGLIGVVIDRDSPAVQFAAHLAASALAFCTANPSFKEPSADPDSVGLQRIVGKHWKVDGLRFQIDADAKFRQGLFDLPERIRHRIAGGLATGACPAFSIDESLPSNCQCFQFVSSLVVVIEYPPAEESG